MQTFFLIEGDLKVEVGFHLLLSKKKEKTVLPSPLKVGHGCQT